MRTVVNVAYLVSAGLTAAELADVAAGHPLTTGVQVLILAVLLAWIGTAWAGEVVARRHRDDAASQAEGRRTTSG